MARKPKPRAPARFRSRTQKTGWDAVPRAERPALVAKIRTQAAAFARLVLSDLPLKRLAEHERVCRGILDFPSDPRRPLAARMLPLIAAAREDLAHGHHAAWQRVEIERLAHQANEMILRPAAAHGQKLAAGGRPGRHDALGQVLVEFLTSRPGAENGHVLGELRRREQEKNPPNPVIQEVDDRARVIRWRSPDGREHETSFKSLLNRLGEIRRPRNPLV